MGWPDARSLSQKRVELIPNGVEREGLLDAHAGPMAEKAGSRIIVQEATQTLRQRDRIARGHN